MSRLDTLIPAEVKEEGEYVFTICSLGFSVKSEEEKNKIHKILHDMCVTQTDCSECIAHNRNPSPDLLDVLERDLCRG